MINTLLLGTSIIFQFGSLVRLEHRALWHCQNFRLYLAHTQLVLLDRCRLELASFADLLNFFGLVRFALQPERLFLS